MFKLTKTFSTWARLLQKSVMVMEFLFTMSDNSKFRQSNHSKFWLMSRNVDLLCRNCDLVY